jgi:NADP-dependent 3-hydroxy acid dehydrogenase YdfG
LTNNPADLEYYKTYHSHSIDLSDEEKVKRIFNTAKTKYDNIDAVIHITGDYIIIEISHHYQEMNGKT